MGYCEDFQQRQGDKKTEITPKFITLWVSLGIKAIISGFLPTTACSVAKLPKSQNNFFTLASALKEKGFNTSFIYGSEAQFDNMAAFFQAMDLKKQLIKIIMLTLNFTCLCI